MSEAFGDVDFRSILLDGQGMHTDLIEAITDVTLERPIDGAPTLSLSLEDPHRVLLNSGILSARATMQVDQFSYELAAVKKAGDTITATFEDLAVAALRRHTAPMKVAAGAMSRVEFVRRMFAEEPWIKLNIGGGAPPSKVELARGNPDAKPPQPGAPVEEPEDSWTAAGRILDEIGWRRYVTVPNTITISNDPATVLFPPNYEFSEFTEGVDFIDYDFDIGKPVATVTMDVRAARWFAAPGVPVRIIVAGPAHRGIFIISSIKRSLFSSNASVTAISPRPVLPEPLPPPEPDKSKVDLGPAEGKATPSTSPAGADVGKQTRVGAISNAGYQWPVNGSISSGFGMRNGKMHEGLDIVVPVGTPVAAAMDGTVIFADSASGYGYVVYISHGSPVSGSPRQEMQSDRETRYGHLSKFNCRRGQVVKRGDIIGFSGGQPGTPGAGDATGPHVHFEIRVGGVAQNPTLLLTGTGVVDPYFRPIKGIS